MIFNSFHFLIFFPIVVFIYFKTPQRWRWVHLLAASYYFYMAWNPTYILLIMGSTLIDYFVSLKMSEISEKRKRRKYLLLSLLSNLGLLFTFKYFNFFSSTGNLLFEKLSIFYHFPKLSVLLPVGISFYTFQTLSYTIDVYHGKIKPEKHLGIFAVYVSFFPQLVAGPIERARNLLPQFRQKFKFNYEYVRYGLILMLWGFFKKVVIADRLATFVDPIYDNPTAHNGVESLIATYFFAFQIFCDFSGYSDIAIGAALILGFKLMQNFRRPYFAQSIQEFWGRWHISLSTWFRDYLYIPLGGNRVSKVRWLINIMIVFLVSGLWHGAYYTFIIWGFLHGFYIVMGHLTSKARKKVLDATGLVNFPRFIKFINILITFHLALFAWIFFRAKYITDAKTIISNILNIKFNELSNVLTHFVLSLGELKILKSDVFTLYESRIAIYALLIMEAVHFLQERNFDLKNNLLGRPVIQRWSAYMLFTLMVIFFGKFSEEQQFIYFQF
ncbi:MBOAT family O-acyltransferase [Fulvivirgaceae bacterium BMA10]|uniref:MBOAT family O-acyltransferase n=1 Tax=Splendidivirga corallicola TaxID=3051826 RepID=A0ABT8KSF8_9BACT|nr:MBOAT family O-acyltransferase [Fulvivirgaceae bacterium BMA10]